MTVEAKYTFSKWFGLKRETRTEIAEFRSISEEITSSMTIGRQPHVEIIRTSADPIREDSTFARAVSEDQLETYDWNPIDNVERNVKVYTGPEINDEGIQSANGRIIYSWRETKPDDYPALRPGQKAAPIELSFNL